MQEVWKDVKGYEGIYQVSNLGNVYSLPRISKQGHFLKGKMLSIHIKRNKPRRATHCSPRRVVSLSTDTGLVKQYLVYRLVAEAFIPNPNNLPEINHIDENSLNDVVTNLEWCTRQYNANYGNCIEKVQSQRRKKVLMFSIDGKLLKKFNSCKEAQEFLGVRCNISGACKGKYKIMKGYIWRYE